VYVVPSTANVRPTWFDRTVTWTGFCVKPAVSVIGPLIVTLAGLFGPVYDPVPVPVHPLKLYPPLAVALIPTAEPLERQPLAGNTVPPLLDDIVR
jgi:hypothetical protein